jgi:hypothetical protein
VLAGGRRRADPNAIAGQLLSDQLKRMDAWGQAVIIIPSAKSICLPIRCNANL